MTHKTEMDEWDIKLNKETAGLLYEAMQQIAVRGPQAKALAELYDEVETAAVMTGAIPKPDEKV